MTHVTTFVVALKTLTLVLGGLITYLTLKAYRRTESRSLGLLATGFALVTIGALLAGAAHQAFGMNTDSVLVIESAMTVLGFGVITYSLYSD